jgi:MarR family transcriptional regulator, organic hydroperoxide resistance regulator
MNHDNREDAFRDWQLLAQLCLAYRSLSDSLMDQIDMHRAQAMVLCRLFNQDGLTQSEIGEQLSVQGATVTNMLQRMEDAGLVARRRDDDDNRVVRVNLTEAGRERERAVLDQFIKLEETIFEGISANDRVRLRQLLNQMLHNMSVKG